jgi:hypothetical protein
LIANALKGLSVSAHKKPAIFKADRDSAIIAALDNLADLILQRRLGSPCESLSDQSDPIANFETSFQFRFLDHFPFPYGPGIMTWPSRKTTFSTDANSGFARRASATLNEGSGFHFAPLLTSDSAASVIA